MNGLTADVLDQILHLINIFSVAQVVVLFNFQICCDVKMLTAVSIETASTEAGVPNPIDFRSNSVQDQALNLFL